MGLAHPIISNNEISNTLYIINSFSKSTHHLTNKKPCCSIRIPNCIPILHLLCFMMIHSGILNAQSYKLKSPDLQGFIIITESGERGIRTPVTHSVNCISSAAHSARLCHLSIISGIFRRKLSCPLRNHNAQNWKNTWKQYLNYTRKMNMKSWWKV